LILFIELI